MEEIREYPFKTKLVTAISKALGSAGDCQSDLIELDNLRNNIKHGMVSAKHAKRHKKLMSLFKSKLHQKRQHLKNVIKTYEN